MSRTNLSKRYARALYGVSEGPSAIEAAGDALNQLAVLFRETPEFRHFLTSPLNRIEERKRVLDTALDSLKCPISVRRLVHLLLERNRIHMLGDIAAQFDERLDDWLNRAEVTVTTAIPLTGDLRMRLMACMEQFTGKTVRLKCRVDPDIVGGLSVQVWGVYFDSSLRTRLERLKQHLLSKESVSYGR